MSSKRFKPIAVRDDRNGNSVISYNPESKEYLLAISGKTLGPMTLRELEVLKENLSDVIMMRGKYLFIKEYDVNGDRSCD